MRRPDDDVHHVRVGRDDGRQGVDRELIALARAEQSEAQEDLPAGEAEGRS